MHAEKVLVTVVQLQVCLQGFIRVTDIDGFDLLVALIVVVHAGRPGDVMQRAFGVRKQPRRVQE